MSSTKISQTASKMAKKLISIHRTPIKLDRIKSMSIEFSRVGKGNTGVRKFIEQQLPLIKYHNAPLRHNTVITTVKDGAADPRLKVELINGKSELFNAKGMDAPQVLDKLFRVNKA